MSSSHSISEEHLNILRWKVITKPDATEQWLHQACASQMLKDHGLDRPFPWLDLPISFTSSPTQGPSPVSFASTGPRHVAAFGIPPAPSRRHTAKPLVPRSKKISTTKLKELHGRQLLYVAMKTGPTCCYKLFDSTASSIHPQASSCQGEFTGMFHRAASQHRIVNKKEHT